MESDETEICKGCLVKLCDDIPPQMIDSLAEEKFYPDVAYRVLDVDRYTDEGEDGEDLVWIGQNVFAPRDIDAFDPLTSLEDQEEGIYEEVMPVPISYVRRVFD